MTKEEIAVLGHAFFDGKTLQYWNTVKWYDWDKMYCPTFAEGEWRIKPDEPKTITICTFMHEDGTVDRIRKNSERYERTVPLAIWTHIKSLDQVVEVE